MAGVLFLMLKKSSDRRQQEAMEKAFKEADVDGDGLLSVDQYYRILKEHGLHSSREEILRLIQMADKDNDGLISKEEFLNNKSSNGFTKNNSTFKKESTSDVAFRIFDENRDGYVTKQEMRKTSKMTKTQIDAVFKSNDIDQDGKLSREEFREFMNRSKKNSLKKKSQT